MFRIRFLAKFHVFKLLLNRFYFRVIICIRKFLIYMKMLRQIIKIEEEIKFQPHRLLLNFYCCQCQLLYRRQNVLLSYSLWSSKSSLSARCGALLLSVRMKCIGKKIEIKVNGLKNHFASHLHLLLLPRPTFALLNFMWWIYADDCWAKQMGRNTQKYYLLFFVFVRSSHAEFYTKSNNKILWCGFHNKIH